jgi:hypothetical protein
MLAGAIGLFLLIRGYGETLTAPPPLSPTDSGRMGQNVDTFFHVLLALGVIVITCRVLGRVFSRLGQPPVVGEVLAGILLGPSLLGRVTPEGANYLLPPSVAPFLGSSPSWASSCTCSWSAWS